MRILLTVLLAMLISGAAWADDDDKYLLRPVPGALARILQRYDLELKKSFADQNLYLVEVDEDDDDDVIERVARDPEVLSFERNEKWFNPETQSGSTSTNPGPLEQALMSRRMTNYFGATVWESFVRQPAAAIVGLAQAQARSTLGAGVVAVIDTGVDPDHPALAGALVAGYDFTREVAGIPNDLADVPAELAGRVRQSTTAFVDNGARPVPLNQYAWAALSQSTTAFVDTGSLPNAFGHGTMVASVIRLVAPQARIMPLKAFLADGSSNTFDLVRAIYFAADHGAKVINMSFHLPVPSAEMDRAVAYAAARGLVLVSSTGNGGNDVVVYPAAHPQVMGIASTDAWDQRSGFSNYGTSIVTLAAPGEGVIVAYPGNNYASAWGTSFSTPMVAGAVTMLLQRNPNWTATQVENELKRRAIPGDGTLGAGRLNVRAW